MARKSVLIIKHGYSETCDHNISKLVSFGDVFRCTCLLEGFRDWDITWITDPAAEDLLAGNKLIDELILAESPEKLPHERIKEHYNTIINLEKQQDWCDFVAHKSADSRFGFKHTVGEGEDCFYAESDEALREALAGENYQPYQETLFKTIGRKWRGEPYSLGYKPKVVEIYDVGLNHHVGPKWPTKRWPEYLWQELYERLSPRYSVSWQQSLNSIRHYIDWLASCRLIITCDSLGLHLGLGLKRKLVALFGPTPPEQVHMYGCGIKLTPMDDRPCVPCFQSKCYFEHSCMANITVDMVVEAVEKLLQVPETAGLTL